MGARISERRNSRSAASCVDSSYDAVELHVVASGEFWYERGSSASRSRAIGDAPPSSSQLVIFRGGKFGREDIFRVQRYDDVLACLAKSHEPIDWDRRTLSYDSARVEHNDDDENADENDNDDASAPPKQMINNDEEDGTATATPHSHYFPAHLFPEYGNHNLPKDNDDCPLMFSTNDDHDDDETKLYNDDDLFDAFNAARLHGSYRKCSSEVGTGSTPRLGGAGQRRSGIPKLPRIGILQADGIVYNDALLLKLANTAHQASSSSRCTTQLMAGVEDFTFIPSPREIEINDYTRSATTDEDRRCYNDIKIHIYDLLTTDSLVEVPYLNCNFPIGRCLGVMNDGCQVLGTGIYHVGVEVNGFEYAFGANDTAGMSGVFTCTPRESPGYEYRETLDFGRVHTTKRTWIRIPTTDDTNSNSNNGAATSDDETIGTTTLLSSLSDDEKKKKTKKNSSTTKYSFHEIESFVDGHSMILTMAREYMGTDYDLLRKNCCTFAHEVCTRLGVLESAIPTYFHNAARAGAHAEDVVNNVENSVRNILSRTAATMNGITPSTTAPTSTKIDDRNGSRDYGYEVILGRNKDDENADGATTMSLYHTVVESSAMRTPHTRRYIDLTSAVSDEVDF